MGRNPVGILVVEEPANPDACAEMMPWRPLDALEHVANQPIIHHALDTLERAGVRNIAVVSSADRALEVRECLALKSRVGGAPLRFLETNGIVDVPTALALAAPYVRSSPCIVHIASGLLSEPLSDFTAQLPMNLPSVVVFLHGSQATGRSLVSAKSMIVRLDELDAERPPYDVAGVLAFGPHALERILALPSTSHARGVESIAARITAAAGSVQGVVVDGWRVYRGDPDDLLALNRIALDRLPTHPRALPHDDDNDIDGRVWIHPTASVRQSVIVGPVVIGAGALVTDAYIGPYTSIGAGVRIEGAEIERSIIYAGASITHLSSRLAASVVGRDARVYRDFSLPRAIRLRIGDGTEIALC